MDGERHNSWLSAVTVGAVVGLATAFMWVTAPTLLQARRPPLTSLTLQTDKISYAFGEQPKFLLELTVLGSEAVTAPTLTAGAVQVVHLSRNGKRVKPAMFYGFTSPPVHVELLSLLHPIDPGGSRRLMLSHQSRHGHLRTCNLPPSKPDKSAIFSETWKQYPIFEPGTYRLRLSMQWRVPLDGAPARLRGKTVRVLSDSITFSVETPTQG